jgi:hypothetical protein
MIKIKSKIKNENVILNRNFLRMLSAVNFLVPEFDSVFGYSLFQKVQEATTRIFSSTEVDYIFIIINLLFL